MSIWFMMLSFNLLIPAIMLISGRLMQNTTPKNINWIIGYRTTMSMKNEDTWAFSHKIAGTFMCKCGWVTLAVTAAAMFFTIGQSVEVVSTVGFIIMFAQLVPVIAVIPHTEKILRNTFDKDGNRKGESVC